MKKWIILLYILVNLLSIYSQKNDATDDNRLSLWQQQSERFKKEMLAKDISFADFAQLKSMAMALGLSEQDNAYGYRDALSKYYNIKLFQSKMKTGDIITLERAGELKMFKIEEENEENLHITGRAKLILNNRDEQNSTITRTIEADDIYIDLKNKEITGIGNVYFKDDSLEFEGEQFYFSFRINRGVLFEGRTKILKSGESGLKDAYFIGERIVQSNKDDAILFNGNLTTCDEENPHYYIKVSKIWINQKGEWGILNGVLYLGPIPFLYIPIYYHPKDLIINPVFGYKSREGWFLNTTYFILGEKSEKAKDSKDVFGVEKNRSEPTTEKSYFRISRADINTNLTDFYNKFDFYKKNPKYKIFPQINNIDIALRFFADAYTNLGFYFGSFYYMKVDSQASPFSLVMLSDFAFSRLLWKNPKAEGYLPYNPDHKTKSIIFEKKADYIHDFSKRNTYYYIDANPLTFRTSQWLKMAGNFNKNIGNQTFKFDYETYIEYASDENYFKDFYGRKLSFTYIDVVFDALKYSIDAQDQKMSNFETKKDETLSSKTEIKNYLKTTFNLPKPPSIFGLDLIGNLNLNTNSTLTLRSSNMANYAPDSSEVSPKYNGGVDDPRYKRYLFDTLTLPELAFSMDGTILDYNIFTNMSTKAIDARNKVIKKGVIDIKDLYQNLETIKNLDASKDTKKLDQKDLFYFFSRKNISNISNKSETKYKFDDVLKFDTDYSYKKDEKTEKKDTPKLKIEYTEPKKIEKEQNLSYTQIKPINFNLRYSFNNNLVNTLKFAPDVSGDNEFDSFQRLFLNKFDSQKSIERFYLNNDLVFRLNGSLQLLNFGSNALYQMSPVLEIRYTKALDNIDFYNNYLSQIYDIIPKMIPKNIYDNFMTNLSFDDQNFLNTVYTLPSPTSTYYYLKSSLTEYEESQTIAILKRANYENPDIKTRREQLDKGNRTKSELKIYYNDTITNDLSFGQQILSGTNLTTTIGIDIFKLNDEKSENFKLLNDINKNNPNYQYVDPLYYFNRGSYEKLQSLNTRLNFALSPIPSDSNHKLTLALSPAVNYIVPQDVLSKMKETLWKSYKNDVTYVDRTSDLEVIAKEFIYYRTNKENLNDSINKFFQKENFWDGAKYFRRIFTDIRFSFNYNYKKNNFNLIELRNDLEFKLSNIGAFSNGKITAITDSTDDREILPLTLYPNNSFNLGLFNNILTYSMSINFTSEIDTNFANYQKLTTDQQALDEFKIMKMVNSHRFNINIDGNLFQIKLPKGSWFRFSSTTDFWYYKNQKWNLKRDENAFYLYSQSLSSSFLMDILTINLNFKAFDFKDRGYGFELDSGSIKLSYNITEIPIFWNYFKFTINPSLSFDFIVKHDDYYEGTNLYQYNTNYYSGNRLTHSISFDLSIGQGTDFETVIRFSARSENNEMYKFFKDDGLKLFFEDLGKSFNFADIRSRKESSFKLKEIGVSLTHKLHDWFLTFSYKGSPEKNSTTNRYNWNNIFTFTVEWKLESENQLMKMFNKTKVNSSYTKGEWQQPILSLDADKN